jgi:predicted RND superfamily exporter protein
VALLGLIALAGMIMRNAVILVDQIETTWPTGHTRREAIVDATVRRARPVVLTALAAILAMIPLSRPPSGGRWPTRSWAGLFVATFLTLLFLPALYALWFRRRLDERGERRRGTRRGRAGRVRAAGAPAPPPDGGGVGTVPRRPGRDGRPARGLAAGPVTIDENCNSS